MTRDEIRVLADGLHKIAVQTQPQLKTSAENLTSAESLTLGVYTANWLLAEILVHLKEHSR